MAGQTMKGSTPSFLTSQKAKNAGYAILGASVLAGAWAGYRYFKGKKEQKQTVEEVKKTGTEQ